MPDSSSRRAARVARLDRIRELDERIARLTTEQRLEIAALVREDTGPRTARYVADELALVWHRSPRQARTRLEGALLFADFPAVHTKIEDGTWLVDHADAVLDELAGGGLEQEQQEQVLDLVLSRDRRRTPWELRVAVRSAIVVLFPDHAASRVDKATVDRDVRVYHEAPGVASLLAHGPAPQVAAMMASLDALTWPAPPGDARTVAQRRFDTLYDLVCGATSPGQWQACVLVSLATVEGRDEAPGELVGHGPIPASMAREVVAGADLRRVVVDETGRLVAVDGAVHRADPPAHSAASSAQPDPRPSKECPEADPHAPSGADRAWLEESTNRAALHAQEDAALGGDRVALRRDADHASGVASESPAEPLLPRRWSRQAMRAVLQRMLADPVRSLDLSTDKYAVPRRLKRHLELRDRTCVFPGCPRRAEQCDKDHLIPWPRGSTSEANLADE
ncbi:MAG TPA: HNH endonuclease signature motif containing protein, partial [Mycobacteriales bacterium]|nr:HNH endonuclease signature motif containing protein [Mycobacteriales bacterium]